jgi:ERCC4-type nuclease
MITLDKRSGSMELLPYFPKGSAQLGNLQFGDACFMGNGPSGPVLVGFERKSIRDLINSVDSGRLQGHQIPGLLSSYNYSYIIIEGLWQPGAKGLLEVWGRNGWRPLQNGKRQYSGSLVDNLMNTLTLLAGITVRQTSNQRHTSLLIQHLYGWWQKDWDSHRGHLGFSCTPHPVTIDLRKPGLVQRVAKEFPGIGWEKSRAAATHFRSVLEMCLSPWTEWEKIGGIGETTAKRIVEAIQHEKGN